MAGEGGAEGVGKEMGKMSKLLVVGGTGYLGRRIVKASLEQGHPTYVLLRPEVGVDIDKVQLLLSFKQQGARLLEASFSDHRSLVDAVSQVDVVVCAISGVHFRSHHIPLQLKLVDAIREAGNVQRFLPSEFGIDPSRMGGAVEPGKVPFDDKMAVRKVVEEAGIPFTYVSAGCFAGYFVGALCEPGRILPPRDRVTLHGSGHVKAIFVDEDDIARYTVRAAVDPRTLNKTLYLRPPENILTQVELVRAWEGLIGRELEKTSVSGEEFLAAIKGGSTGYIEETQSPIGIMGLDYAQQVGLGHYYQVFYEGCLTNFAIGEGAEEATELYPDLAYTRVKDYLKRYL